MLALLEGLARPARRRGRASVVAPPGSTPFALSRLSARTRVPLPSGPTTSRFPRAPTAGPAAPRRARGCRAAGARWCRARRARAAPRRARRRAASRPPGRTPRPRRLRVGESAQVLEGAVRRPDPERDAVLRERLRVPLRRALEAAALGTGRDGDRRRRRGADEVQHRPGRDGERRGRRARGVTSRSRQESWRRRSRRRMVGEGFMARSGFSQSLDRGAIAHGFTPWSDRASTALGSRRPAGHGDSATEDGGAARWEPASTSPSSLALATIPARIPEGQETSDEQGGHDAVGMKNAAPSAPGSSPPEDPGRSRTRSQPPPRC